VPGCYYCLRLVVVTLLAAASVTIGILDNRSPGKILLRVGVLRYSQWPRSDWHMRVNLRMAHRQELSTRSFSETQR